jgi:hypothetical protein
MMAVTVQTAIKLMAMMTLGPESSKGECRGVDQWGAEFNPLPAAAEEHLPHVVFQSACLEIVRYRTTHTLLSSFIPSLIFSRKSETHLYKRDLKDLTTLSQRSRSLTDISSVLRRLSLFVNSRAPYIFVRGFSLIALFF